MKRIPGAIVGLLVLAAPASAQWVKQRDSSLPRSLDGQANLSVRSRFPGRRQLVTRRERT
jgi:hypothetical protein